jgi:hypothetical protein
MFLFDAIFCIAIQEGVFLNSKFSLYSFQKKPKETKRNQKKPKETFFKN